MESIPNLTSSKLAAIGKTIPGMLITLLFVCTFFREWLIIGVVSNPADIAQYPFGSEEAMSDGGWYYLNGALYARAMLTCGIVLLIPLLTFGFAILKRTTVCIVVAYGLLVIACLAIRVLGHYQIA